MKRTLMPLCLLMLLLLAGCGGGGSDNNGNNSGSGQFTVDGTVTRVLLGGSFYGIVTDTGSKYDPINLGAAFQQDSLPVRITAKLRPDLVSTHSWGEVIELISINQR